MQYGAMPGKDMFVKIFLKGTTLGYRGLVFFPFPAGTMMMLDQQYHEELRALRNLEKAVRICLLSGGMLSGQRQTQLMASALREVVAARKTAIKKSKFTPFK